MAEVASAHQAATSTREESGQQTAGRRRRPTADPQRAHRGATVAAAGAPAALDGLSRLQHLADASPQVAQLRRLQALADGRFAPVTQLAGGPEEEELIQGKIATAELPPQRQQAPRPNNTGLPDQLKSGIESLSGLSMDHVRVHYNSAQPEQLNALAYAQGSEIHLAPGQERHLPHEAWHVVQQAQGRVKPTMQAKGVAINEDLELETEADAMGEKALKANDELRNAKNPVQFIAQFARGKKSKHDRKAGRLAKAQGIERSTPNEEERGFSVVSQSECTNPYQPSEIADILQKIEPGKLFDIDPSRIRTMHAGISNRFSNDVEIIDLVQELKDNPTNIKHIPPIMVSTIELPKRKWERQDELEQRNTKELTLFTEDHRRVVAARMAGIKEMKAQMKADPSIIGNFTTKNRGLSVDIRKYHDTKEGRHQGGNKTTLPSSAKVYKYKESEKSKELEESGE